MGKIWKCLQMLYNRIKVILSPYYHEDYVFEIYHSRTYDKVIWREASKLKNREKKEIFILFFKWCNEQILHRGPDDANEL